MLYLSNDERGEDFDEQIRRAHDHVQLGRRYKKKFLQRASSSTRLHPTILPSTALTCGDFRLIRAPSLELIGIEARCQNLVELTVWSHSKRVERVDWLWVVQVWDFHGVHCLCPGRRQGVHGACAIRKIVDEVTSGIWFDSHHGGC